MRPSDQQGEGLTAQQVAEMMGNGLNKRTIERYIKDGTLPSYEGRNARNQPARLVKRADVEAYMAKLPEVRSEERGTPRREGDGVPPSIAPALVARDNAGDGGALALRFAEVMEIWRADHDRIGEVVEENARLREQLAGVTKERDIYQKQNAALHAAQAAQARKGALARLLGV